MRGDQRLIPLGDMKEISFPIPHQRQLQLGAKHRLCRGLHPRRQQPLPGFLKGIGIKGNMGQAGYIVVGNGRRFRFGSVNFDARP